MTEKMVLPSFCTLSAVERIASLPDPVLRNLQITQCYHELALVLADRTAGSANWCTFATWASKQAGQTIRKEDMRRAAEFPPELETPMVQAAQALQAGLQRIGVPRRLEEILGLVWKAYDLEGAFDHSSAAVARGNLKVFQEIAREFARFNAQCLPDPVRDPGSIERFSAQLKPGDPPDGQRYLCQAFRRYYQALFETDEKARVELLLLANLEIGFHEQTRLQPEINEALSAPVLSPQAFARNLIQALLPGSGRLAELGWALLRRLGLLAELENAIDGLVAGARREAQFLVTHALMTIELPPGRRLSLGDDLASGFPPLLHDLTHPELLALLARIDPTPGSTRESGADIWGDLSDRIHFIADLFRCYQTASELLDAPFSHEQTQALKEGRLPGGRL